MQLFGERCWFDRFQGYVLSTWALMQMLPVLEAHVQILFACSLFLDFAVLLQIAVDSLVG